MSDEEYMRIIFLAITRHLDNAIEECTKMKDVEVFQEIKKKLEDLNEEVRQETMKHKVL